MAEEKAENRPLTIGILAGEASGDNLGAGLMAELQRLHPGSHFVGVGGPRMQALGLETLHPFDRLAVNGFVDPLLRLPELLGLLRRLTERFLSVDAFIGIDFNVFNLLLERRLKKRGVKTVHYVSPSVYAWRKGRAKKLGTSTDLLLTLYPFEPAFYQGLDVQAEFVGHPLAHAITEEHASDSARQAAREALGLGAGPVVAILPGSRNSEVALMAPSFFGAAELLRRSSPVQFVVPCLNETIAARVQELLPSGLKDSVVMHMGDARLALTACDVALVKSGTSTLEAMCLARPFVVSYRLGKWSYQLARRLVHTPFVALPNILAGRALVPELLQDDATPEALADAVTTALTRADDQAYIDEFRTLREGLKLGDRASQRAAQVTSRFLSA